MGAYITTPHLGTIFESLVTTKGSYLGGSVAKAGWFGGISAYIPEAGVKAATAYTRRRAEKALG
jgi:hypothetical protein